MNLINKNEIETISFNPIQVWNLHLIGFKFSSNFFVGKIVNKFRDKTWYKNGKKHRIDGPAIEFSDGTKYWYQEGKKHRLDGPAIEYSYGSKSWYKEGKRHRLDGPAIEYENGDKEWYKEGIRYSSLEF